MGTQQGPHPPVKRIRTEGGETPLVGPRNEGEVEVNGKACKALIDSGSQVTSITHNYWQSHPALQKKKLQSSKIPIEGAAGQTVPYHGVLHIDLKVLGKEFKAVPTFVVPDSDYRSSVPLLVGTNVIRASLTHLQAVYGTQFLHQVKEKHPEWYTALQKVESAEQSEMHDVVGPAVYTGCTIHIPGGKEMDLRCKIKAGPQRKTYTALIEGHPSLQLPQDVLVGKVLANVKRGCAPVRVMNLSQRVVTIKRHTNLASVVLVDKVVEFPDKKHDEAGNSGACLSLDQVVTSCEVDLSKAAVESEGQRTLLKDLLDKNADVFSQHPLDYGHTTTVQHEIPLVDPRPFRLPYRRIPLDYSDRLSEAQLLQHPRCIPSAKDRGGSRGFRTSKVLFHSRPHIWILASGGCRTRQAQDSIQYSHGAVRGQQNALWVAKRTLYFSKSFNEHLERLQLAFDRLREHGLKLKPSKCQLVRKEVQYLGHLVSAEGIRTDPEKISKVKDWERPTNRMEVLRFLGFVGYYRRYVKGYSNLAAPLYRLTSGDPRKKKRGTQKNPSPDQPFLWTADCEEAFQSLKEKLISAPVLGYPDYSLPFLLQTDASGMGLGAVLVQVQDGVERVIAYASRGLSPPETRYPAHKLEFLALKWAVTDKFHDHLYGRKFSVLTDNNPLKYVMTSAKLDATGQRWVSHLSIYDFDIQYRRGQDNSNADALSRISNQEVAETLQSCPQQVRMGGSGHEEAQTTQEPEEVSGEDKAVVEEPESGQPLGPSEVYVDVGMETLPAMTTQELRAGQKEDPVIGPILHFKSRSHKPSHSERMKVGATGSLLLKEWRRLVIKKGILYRRVRDCHKGVVEQLILPERLRETVNTALHNESGHLGFERTLQMIRERFYWPRMFQEVKAWCEQCERCCLRKTPTVNVRAPLVSIHTGAPMELVCVDFLTLEKSKGGMENVLIVTDHFSRYAQAYPTRDQKAGTVARVLWRNFFCRFGFPAKLHADQGRNFESAIVKELCKCTGITKTHTTPYHPQGNGTTERFNRTLMNMLGTLEPHLKPRWHEHVDAMTHAYNCSRHDSTGYSPYYLMFGRHPRLPVDLIFGSPTTNQPCEYSEYVQTLYDSLSQAYALANQTSRLAKRQQKKYYDKKAKSEDFSPGDRVLVKVCHVEGKQKLGDRWGAQPYVVVKKQPGLPVYVVQPEDGGAERVVHRNLLTQCMFLPVERDEGLIEEEDESDGRSGIELEAEEETGVKRADRSEQTLDKALIGTVDKEEEQISTEEADMWAEETSSGEGVLVTGNGATSTQGPRPPRRNPRRTRRPPTKLSLESQVVKLESDHQKIERGRKLWLKAK
ncbi:hypothetical protein M9458_000382, partial [Cirrhinus mrigala]